MPFGRRADPEAPPQPPLTPGERLVRRTAAGLAVFTLALIAILLAAVGLVTSAAALQVTDASVDANLRAASDNMLIVLTPTPTPTPPPTPTPTPTKEPDDTETPEATNSPRPTETDDHGGGEDGSGRGGRVRQPTVVAAVVLAAVATPSAPAQSPTSTPRVAPVPTAAVESAGKSGTFFLVVDAAGSVISNPQGVPLADLPEQAAVAGALSGADDWRTVTVAGEPIRLRTVRTVGLDGETTGALQSGFYLGAQREQQALIVRTIVIASLVGLLGAAVVTLFVTRRAMAPIRSAFDAERRFVASASHELKTPVAIVRASAEILQRENLVAADGAYLVEDVLAESDRLARLVNDLLALASAEAGQITIQPQVFDARKVVEEAVTRVAEMARARAVSVEAVQDLRDVGSPRDHELLIEADRERMLQLLLIFIDNAIDHSPMNGIVRVVCRPAGEGKNERVAIDVLDQGPGVPFAERDRIFEPFAKVGGRRRASGSTGLGLAIARILAARQDAMLAVRDAPGGGACFSVSLARRSTATP